MATNYTSYRYQQGSSDSLRVTGPRDAYYVVREDWQDQRIISTRLVEQCATEDLAKERVRKLNREAKAERAKYHRES